MVDFQSVVSMVFDVTLLLVEGHLNGYLILRRLQ